MFWYLKNRKKNVLLNGQVSTYVDNNAKLDTPKYFSF